MIDVWTSLCACLTFHVFTSKKIPQALGGRLDRLQQGLSRQLSGSESFVQLLTDVNLFSEK